MRHALCSIIFASWSLLLFPALAQSSGSDGIAFSLTDLPGGPASGIVHRPRQTPAPDAAALARTGAKKGIFGSSLAAEVKASPDAAVLNAGLAQEWRLLLADLGEFSTLVGPDELAAAGRTKPLLIIPSGALAAYGESSFSRAGLAEYVRSGGIILCFSQQRGVDLSALPLDEGAKIEAAGWSEDAGPLFRASAIQQQHPFLSGETTALPGIETDGYFISYPKNAAVLLARHDGFPTLIIYPFGSGWVVAATLFSERLHALGHLGAEERALLRDMVSWAKAGGNIRSGTAGRRVDLKIDVIGQRDTDAAEIKFLMIGPDKSVTAERTMPRPVRRREKVAIPVSFTLQSDALPGIHHVEYILLDSGGRPISTARESANGWVNLGSAPTTGAIPRTPKPLAAPKLLISDATARIKPVNTLIRMDLDITTGPGAELPQPVLVRAGSRERIIQLTKERTTLSLDLPSGDAEDTVPFSLSLSGNGRLLFRGSAESPGRTTAGIFLEHAAIASGEPFRIGTKGLGSGELTLFGLGSIQDSMTREGNSFEFTVPVALPDGAYPLLWEFRSMDDSIRKGSLTLPHLGYRVRIQSLAVKERRSWWRSRIEVKLGITSTAPVAGRLRLQLRGPAGTKGPVLEKEIKLTRGQNDLTLVLPFKPSQSGIWELQTSFLVTLPDGAGLPHEPVIIASATTVFDAGTAAVLGISTERPLYEDPSGPVLAAVSVFGSGTASMTVSLDGQKFKSEQLVLTGHHNVPLRIDTLKEGARTLSADLRQAGLSSYRTLAFTYGTNLPDLAMDLTIPQPAGASLPITLLVRNQGRTSSDPSRAALMESDASPGQGTVIGSITVPALKSGEAYSTILEWPLWNKAGSHTLRAVADAGGTLIEADKENNIHSATVSIPETVFFLAPQKDNLFSDEEMEFHAAMVNLTSRSLEGLNMQFQLFGPRGALMASGQTTVPLLGPGAEQRITRSLRLPSAPFGAYRAAAVLTKDRVIAEADASLTLLPTPLLQGTLVGTPAATGSCRPFTITYDARSAGNVPVTEGTVQARILPMAAGQKSMTKESPFSQGAGSFRIGRLDLPPGGYTVQLKGSATNNSHKVTRETVMAEQSLTITSPVSVRRNSSPMPRVLVLHSGLEQGAKKVVTGKLLADAFDRGGIFHTLVDRPADFLARAGTGLYNTFVLFEPDEMFEGVDELKQRVQDGDGLIIVGDGRISMTIAESFGFKFAPALSDATHLLDVGGELRSALTGTLPVCGPLLPPARKGARSLAQLSGSGQPAMLIGSHGKGKVLVMPFSVTRSAVETGSIPLYGLLLCTALPSVQPEQESPGGIIARELTITATEGRVRTRIIERLPAGAQVVQSNNAVVKDGALIYEVAAEPRPQRLLYLYRAPSGSSGPVSREVQYECGGNFISGGIEEQ